MKKPIVIGLAVIGALITVVFGSGILSQQDDKTQIQNALDRAIKASKEGRPGGVLEYLSADFELNQTKFTGGQIARRIKEMKPDVEVKDRNVTVSDSTATMASPVSLSLTLPPMKMEISKVNLEFRREDSRRMLIFPSKDWKLYRVSVPDNVYEELNGQYGAMEMPGF